MSEPFTIEYNGLTMGDGTPYNISFFDPGELPTRIAEQLAAGRDGGFVFNVNVGMRIIRMNLEIDALTPSDLFSAIDNLRSAIYRTSETKVLTINYWTTGRTRTIDVVPTILPNPTHSVSEPSISRGITVEFKAPFPFYTDGTTTSVQLTLNEPGGFDLPFDLPFDLEGGGSGNSYTFNNDSDVDALVSITVNGSVINATVQNLTQNRLFQIEDTLTGSESVTGQYTQQGRSIKYNDGTSAESVFNGATQVFFVPPGNNTFRFTASTFDASASCDLVFTKYLI